MPPPEHVDSSRQEGGEPLARAGSEDTPSGEVTVELLSADRLSRKFGGLWALYDVSFTVQTGEIAGVIGPNGAGKTTLFNCLSGLDYASEGRIFHRGKDIARLSPHQVVKRGIVRTFQTTRVFRRLSVLENVMVGLHLHSRGNLFSDMLGLPVARRESRREAEESRALLEAVRLLDQADTPADELTLSQARRMELARALATGPELLLLDEPGAGLDERERDELGVLLQDVHGRGVTLMVIEHDIGFVVNLCTRVIVLNYGQIISMGTPEAVQRDEKVLEAYLGEEDSDE